MENIPDEFICPISLEIMTDPVICSDGFTYERSSIGLFRNNLSPMTRERMNMNFIVPNLAIRQLIEKYLKKNTFKTNTVSEFKMCIGNVRKILGTFNYTNCPIKNRKILLSQNMKFDEFKKSKYYAIVYYTNNPTSKYRIRNLFTGEYLTENKNKKELQEMFEKDGLFDVEENVYNLDLSDNFNQIIAVEPSNLYFVEYSPISNVEINEMITMINDTYDDLEETKYKLLHIKCKLEKIRNKQQKETCVETNWFTSFYKNVFNY